MSPDFSAALLREQYGFPTPEWHPSVGERAAAAARVRLCEDALWDEQQDEAAS